MRLGRLLDPDLQPCIICLAFGNQLSSLVQVLLDPQKLNKAMQHIQTKKKKYKKKGEKIYEVVPVFYGAYTVGHVWYSFTTAHTSRCHGTVGMGLAPSTELQGESEEGTDQTGWNSLLLGTSKLFSMQDFNLVKISPRLGFLINPNLLPLPGEVAQHVHCLLPPSSSRSTALC